VIAKSLCSWILITSLTTRDLGSIRFVTAVNWFLFKGN
jgi:hypothetical protein